MALNPEHLLTFVRVARLGSLSAAAEELNLTQPAVSSQLKLLTQAVGEPIFRRHRTGVTLTGAGEGLLVHAQALGRVMDGARTYVHERQGLETGTLRLAASSTIAASLLPAALASYHAQYPGVAFEIRQGNTQEVMGLLQAGQIEVALIEGPPGPLPAEWQVQVFGHDELVLVAAPDHPLVDSFPADTVLPLIWREHGSGTREVAEQALAHTRMVGSNRLELPGTEAVKEAVIQGLGVALLPELRVRREVQSGVLVRLPLDLPELRRPLSRVSLPLDQVSYATRSFLNGLETRLGMR
ncbi:MULTISPECIES: LysR family transcriptional regulator [Deinococcus]|uniref:LysR family transcriptional regulator n=5 Tax=Deinococcus TaxID=1298 RepID=A0A117DPK4_9DEIO|nr:MULTISPECIES: LysR family transcriptional regulator [Deinococcus]MXV21237.1 LysR family transcriptional regulator [Deinococcus xianganensis]BBN97112.1 LysR family transcriptional regulator [Deinococcus grandis]GAQ23612.1 LysR family transcriptional regulator [Deinococcus grandis]GGL19169.1 LysR family transcriptional regulator [Deinococcus radiotolerans]GGR71439.1 LysR family transcriptional regulator [Deinococcus seoulensis]